MTLRAAAIEQFIHAMLRSLSSNRTGSWEVQPRSWRRSIDARSRGFIKLWQFRSPAEAASPPADRGPHWREPRLARLEAVLFLAREPLSSRRIAQFANLADGTEARTLIRRLRRLYDAAGSAFQIHEVAGGYQLLTRPEFGPWLRRFVQASGPTRLSAPAMETLVVVAYQQPILRAEIESIRGVQCDDILRQLLERDLLRIVGRSEDLGRPLLYGTTKRFLELFGLKSLEDLPRTRASATVTPSTNQSGESRTNDTRTTSQTLEEKSVTTRIRPVGVVEELEEPSATLLEATRRAAAKPIVAAEEDDEADDEDEDWDDDDDDDDEDDDEESDDDFVDDEWEEVDDDEADEDEDEEDEEEWDEDEDDDEDWDDDEDEEEEAEDDKE